LCDSADETVSHLFFTCKVVTHIWKNCENGYEDLLFIIVMQIHFEQFVILEYSSKCDKVWRCVWVTIVWSIWNHRNDVIFRNAKVDAEKFFTLAKMREHGHASRINIQKPFFLLRLMLMPTSCLILV